MQGGSQNEKTKKHVPKEKTGQFQQKNLEMGDRGEEIKKYQLIVTE